jgi:hypothetical protein
MAEPPQVSSPQRHLQGSITILGIDTGSGGKWAPLPQAEVGADRWYSGSAVTSKVTPAGGGFTWNFDDLPPSATVQYRDRPFPLPAIATRTVTTRTGPFDATGLDGSLLPVDVIATVKTIPGALGTGVVVDLRYAQLAQESDLTSTQSQVWLVGDEHPIETRLRAEGVSVDQVSTAAGMVANLRRSGPGLADTLFLGEAAAAAALAAGTSIVALYLLARRRRYELAALMTVGVDRGRLIASVLAEQVLIVAYGALVGVIAGLGTAAVLLRDIPQFATEPAGVPLATLPQFIPVAPILAGSMLVVLVGAAVAAVHLVTGTDLNRLREAPS